MQVEELAELQMHLVPALLTPVLAPSYYVWQQIVDDRAFTFDIVINFSMKSSASSSSIIVGGETAAVVVDGGMITVVDGGTAADVALSPNADIT